MPTKATPSGAAKPVASRRASSPVSGRRSMPARVAGKTRAAAVSSDETSLETAVPGLPISDLPAASLAVFADAEKPKPILQQEMENVVKTAEEMMSFSQGNLEAFVKSGQIWSTGLQALSKEMAATAQASLDETMGMFKAMTSVKSLKEAMDIQAGLARSTMEKSVSETGKLADASFKLAEQAFAPITERVSLAVETFAKTR